ncbi:AAA family ATPase, partial [Sphaerisporangium sp. TRM90804]|uniref:AAA family ATPase n=1 Tax=Sphaerisporangium sp. TRM90804 TaxID=3031113 RepID=UPI0024475822
SLLQILEDGRLTDAQGRVVDFKNTVVIMTTNLGSRGISKGPGLGFATAAGAGDGHARMRAQVQEELKRHFRPEFLNRIDDIVVFHQLAPEEIIQIVDLMLAQIALRMKDRDMDLEVAPEARRLLGEHGYDPVLGARPLRRTIQRELEDTLSEKILYGELRPGHVVSVAVENGALTVTGADRPLMAGLDRVELSLDALLTGDRPPPPPNAERMRS